MKKLHYLHIIISERTTEFVIVHAGLVLTDAPETGYLFCPPKLEFAIIGGPADDIFVPSLLEELQKELPQGDSTVHSSELKFTRGDRHKGHEQEGVTTGAI